MEKLCNLIGGGMKEMIDLVYPVGRTITCDHNPQDDYPWQKWEQDFKDRFPLGAGDTYSEGATGGEAQHTLTVDEMPNHRHSSDNYQDGYANANLYGTDKYTTWVNYGIHSNNEPFSGETGPVRTSWVGGSKPHNNLPPYKAACMWTRTA